MQFTVTGHGSRTTKNIGVAANTVSCSSAWKASPGSYKVTESAGLNLTGIQVQPSSRGSGASIKKRSVTAKVMAGKVTTAGFTNQNASTPPPVPPPPVDPGNGYIEVCKYAANDVGGSWVSGSVNVTITSGTTTFTQVIPVGQCTGPLSVPAGTATVTETSFTGPSGQAEYLESATTNPTADLLTTSSTTNTVTATVAASTDSSTETVLNLYNSTELGSVKVCKELTSNSGDLVTASDNTFTFNASYREAGNTTFVSQTKPVTVLVPATGTLECTYDPQLFPIGTEVRVSEVGIPNTTLSGVAVSPATQTVPATGIADLIVGPNPGGTTAAEFTDSADGTVEICKQMDDSNWYSGWKVYETDKSKSQGSPYDGTPFQFSVNGGAPVTVDAGECSGPISVPAGTATVQELASPNFHLLSFTAVGPDNSSRLTTTGTTNPAVVTVPWGGLTSQGIGNETLVMATNQVNTGQVKICKVLGDGVPVGKTFGFGFNFSDGPWAFEYGGTSLTPTADGSGGEVCSFLSNPLPVVDPSGNPISFTVTECASPFGDTDSGGAIVEPTDIEYGGNGAMTSSETYIDNPNDDGGYYGTANIGQGVNAMTFTNTLVLDP